MSDSANDDALDPRWIGASIPQDHWHFHRRLLERYGVVLGPGEYSKIKKKIAKGRFRAVASTRRGNVYQVFTRSAPRGFFILANGIRLVTAWPPGAIKKLRRKEISVSGRLNRERGIVIPAADATLR